MILLSLQVYNKKCADLIFSIVSDSVLLCYWGVECEHAKYLHQTLVVQRMDKSLSMHLTALQGSIKC